jgi:hypothetical protein
MIQRNTYLFFHNSLQNTTMHFLKTNTTPNFKKGSKLYRKGMRFSVGCQM